MLDYQVCRVLTIPSTMLLGLSSHVMVKEALILYMGTCKRTLGAMMWSWLWTLNVMVTTEEG